MSKKIVEETIRDILWSYPRITENFLNEKGLKILSLQRVSKEETIKGGKQRIDLIFCVDGDFWVFELKAIRGNVEHLNQIKGYLKDLGTKYPSDRLKGFLLAPSFRKDVLFRAENMGIQLLPYDPSDLLRQRDLFLQSEEYTRRLPAKSSPVGRLQYVIRFLNYIYRSGGRASIADISKHQDVVRYGSRAWRNPKARIGQYIWLTENMGLLEKTDDLVLLTEAGRELMHKGEPLDTELRDFTDEQRRFLCLHILSYTNKTPLMRGIILFASALDELSGYSVPVTNQDLECYFPIKAGKKGEWRQRTTEDQVNTYGLFCVSLGIVLVFKRHGYKEYFLTERGCEFVKVSVLNRIQEDLLKAALLTE